MLKVQHYVNECVIKHVKDFNLVTALQINNGANLVR